MSKLPVFLRVINGGKAVEMKQFNDEQIIIGQVGNATLGIADSAVGAIHCMIEERNGKYFLCDLGTEHGTFYKSQKIVEVEIKSGENFRIGETIIEFHIGIPRPIGVSSVGAPIPTPTPQAPPASVRSEKTPPPKSEPKVEPRKDFILKAPPKQQAPQAPPPKAVTTSKPTHTSGASGMVTAPRTMSPFKKGTFAPPSNAKIKESLKPSHGTVVEVVIMWQDRILSTHHFDKQKIVKVGSHPDNDIILPVLGSIRLSYGIIKITSGAHIFLTSDMTGEVVKKDGTKTSFLDLKRNGKIQASGSYLVYTLQQNELIRIQFGEGIEFIVRYVGSVPETRLAPIFDFTVNQLTALVISLVAAFIFLFYVFIYAPPPPEKVEEETIPPRKAQFYYKKRDEEIKPLEPLPSAAPKTAQETIKDKEVAPARGEEGGAQEAKKNNSQSQKQILTTDKAGKDKGIQKAVVNNKQGATPKVVAKDVTKSGLMSVFGTKGVQEQLNKAFQGSGNVTGLSHGATGQGGEAAGAGIQTGAGLKEIGKGGSGTATVGIAGPKTKGRGGGLEGYGTGPLGAKKNATILAGSDDATFSGTIDKDAIRRVVQANLKQIKACYEKGLNRDPGLYGKIVIQWTIGAEGRVLEAGIKNTTMNNTEVENCAVLRLKTWKFPEPPVNEVAVVSYPFVFQAQE